MHWLLWTLCIYWDVQWTLCTTCEHSVNIGLLWTLFYTQWWVQPTCWTERKNKEEGQAHPFSFCEDEKVITVNVKAYTACTFAYSTRQDKVYSVQRWRCWSDKKIEPPWESFLNFVQRWSSSPLRNIQSPTRSSVDKPEHNHPHPLYMMIQFDINVKCRPTML